ncbi:unnamed protein product [Vitrella brassicaformis CCMP3155]|uniref:Uncharacterized protein n=1 Tax=Vitrella brassicaformis (strain CCMP3155) TaxID=1169540 RepID=A0A0G4F319_VITBC|nr:unnamed protein product [Vitrella brassicaformis CCMP3155]|eukprot:CEM06439.1 unnamed protein product [Vitrella brassicaformis CCMP3155]
MSKGRPAPSRSFSRRTTTFVEPHAPAAEEGPVRSFIALPTVTRELSPLPSSSESDDIFLSPPGKRTRQRRGRPQLLTQERRSRRDHRTVFRSLRDARIYEGAAWRLAFALLPHFHRSARCAWSALPFCSPRKKTSRHCREPDRESLPFVLLGLAFKTLQTAWADLKRAGVAVRPHLDRRLEGGMAKAPLVRTLRRLVERTEGEVFWVLDGCEKTRLKDQVSVRDTLLSEAAGRFAEWTGRFGRVAGCLLLRSVLLKATLKLRTGALTILMRHTWAQRGSIITTARTDEPKSSRSRGQGLRDRALPLVEGRVPIPQSPGDLHPRLASRILSQLGPRRQTDTDGSPVHIRPVPGLDPAPSSPPDVHTVPKVRPSSSSPLSPLPVPPDVGMRLKVSPRLTTPPLTLGPPMMEAERESARRALRSGTSGWPSWVATSVGRKEEAVAVSGKRDRGACLLTTTGATNDVQTGCHQRLGPSTQRYGDDVQQPVAGVSIEPHPARFLPERLLQKGLIYTDSRPPSPSPLVSSRLPTARKPLTTSVPFSPNLSEPPLTLRMVNRPLAASPAPSEPMRPLFTSLPLSVGRRRVDGASPRRLEDKGVWGEGSPSRAGRRDERAEQSLRMSCSVRSEL